ncbi:MAG: choice-of-anchor V domain-containing protein [Chitinophagales bacterium]|nr:hypothetical protein [Chitinophagales bacterium]MDW8394097.1 choice-of-anchor V domain-containing protein [Chitinophagales bacterium]
MRLLKPSIIFLAIAPLSILVGTVSYNNDLQPPGSRTGAPSESTCGASSCHNNTPNTGPGSVSLTFSNPSLKYTPGDTFQITVKVTDNTKTKWGFELTALNATNDSTPGKFLNEASGILVSFPNPISSLSKREYVAHRDANTATSQWVINWIAPSTNIGDICFYAAGNAANNNGTTSGDNIYTASLCISPETGVGIAAVSDQSSLFSIDAIRCRQLSVTYQLAEPATARFVLMDLSGRMHGMLLESDEPAGQHSRTLSLPSFLPGGIYVLIMQAAGNQYAAKFYYQP